MPRQTREQVDAEIIDRAAALFARHGFANTSLQQIADAVRYSKAGLLHHFASKEAIYLAVRAVTVEQLAALARRVEELPPGADRDREALGASVDLTYAWPGVATLAASFAEQDEDPELVAAAVHLARAFGLDDAADDDRAVRVLVATSGLTSAALTAVRSGTQKEWRERIVDVAMEALGHHG